MRCKPVLILLLALAPLPVLGGVVLGAQPSDSAAAEQAIREASNAYLAALKEGNAEAMLSLWTSDGDIVDEQGNATPASQIIQQDVAARASAGKDDAAALGPKMVENKIRFITPHVAIEDGRVEVSRGNVETISGRFTAIWVNTDDHWKLASLREVRLPAQRGDDLKALDRMAGDWVGQSGGAAFRVSAHWNEKHTFLVRKLTVTHDGKTVIDGEQRIGIDPLDGQVKSWMHDADGGHGEGVWTLHGDSWVVQASGVTPEGHRTTGTNIYQFTGPDSFTWKSSGASSNGRHVPDFEITLKRVHESAK